MSEKRAEGWTVETALAHLETLIEEKDRRYEQRFLAQQDAMKQALAAVNLASEKAEANGDKWRASANEWRQAMNDRERQFLPRIEAAQLIKSLEDRVTSLKEDSEKEKERGDKGEGRSSGVSALWGWIVAAAMLASNLYLIFRPH